MSKNAAGLDFQAAWDEAVEEDGVPAPDSDSPGNESPTPTPPAEVEQPAVESDDEGSLFAELVEEKPEDEQPKDLDSLTVDVGGEQVSVAELRAGYMRQADYTRKTQELSEERKDSEVAVNLYRALQKNPTATIQKLWDSHRQGTPIAPETEEVSGGMDIDALVEQKLSERLENDPRLKAIEEQRAVDRVNAIFDQLEEVYGTDISDEDRNFVLQKAYEAGTADISMVFGALMQQRQMLEKQRDNAVANSTGTGYGGEQGLGKRPAEKKSYGSFRDAMSDTFAEEGISSDALESVVSNL